MKTLTDEQVRRRMLTASGWEPYEIDQWLALHPKPSMLAEEQAILRERLHDAMFEVCKGLGIIRLARRLGMEPRRWVLDRED